MPMKVISLFIISLILMGCAPSAPQPDTDTRVIPQEEQVSHISYGWKQMRHSGQKYYLYECDGQYLQLFTVPSVARDGNNRQRNLLIEFEAQGFHALDVIKSIQVNGDQIEFIISALSPQRYGAEPVDEFYPLKAVNNIQLVFSNESDECSIPPIFFKIRKNV
jgi:hypothetical protein